MIFARPHRPHNGREKVRTKSGGEGYKKLESQGPQPPKSGGFRVLWGIRLMVGSRVLPIPAGATKLYERIRTHSRSGRCALRPEGWRSSRIGAIGSCRSAEAGFRCGRFDGALYALCAVGFFENLIRFRLMVGQGVLATLIGVRFPEPEPFYCLVV